MSSPSTTVVLRSSPSSSPPASSSSSSPSFLSSPFSSLFSLYSSAINHYYKGRSAYQVHRDTVLLIASLYVLNKIVKGVRTYGARKYAFRTFLSVVQCIPFASREIAKEKSKVIGKIGEMMSTAATEGETKYTRIPAEGMPSSDLLALLKRWQSVEDRNWRQGQVSGGIYHGGEQMLSTLTQVYGMFALSNPLHPEVFPFIRKMEAEVIQMTIHMFRGDEGCCGTMTAGGTESILMAMKSYRDYSRAKRGIETPEIIAATTVHAAFDKAAHYFGMRLVHIPVDVRTFQIDVNKVKSAINKNTVVIVGSAPCFPQGTMDDIEALAALALKHNIGMHVDSCLGGFLLPFVRDLGYQVPPFDFSVRGVTSISADTHKYGYAPKGSSVVMYRSAELRQYQYFVASEWMGGIYASPSMPGSRPGGLIAATWAAMIHMGYKGYLDCARDIMAAAKAIEAGIKGIEGLKVLGNPVMSVIAFAADPQSAKGRDLNIFKVGEAMSKRDWKLNSLQKPAAIHICCTYMHKGIANKFISDLRESVEDVIAHPDAYKHGSAAIYGMAESLPDGSIVEDIAKGFLDQLLKA